MPRGRPRDSAPQSYHKLYSRLFKGPLWLEDWQSTGLARSTVHDRLKYLLSVGLVETQRNGRRKEYFLPEQNRDRVLTLNNIEWHRLLYPYSRKQKRQLRKQFRKTGKEYFLIMEEINTPFRVMEEIWKKIDEFLKDPKSQTVLQTLKIIGVDWHNFSILKLLNGLIFPYHIGTLCIDCLKNKRVVYFITIPETGEIICPREGILQRVEMVETPVKTIPPYKYRRIFRP